MTEVYNFFQIKATALTDELRIYNLTISGYLKKLFKGIGFVCKKSGSILLKNIDTWYTLYRGYIWGIQKEHVFVETSRNQKVD
jgi:hypothetical protein